MEKSAEMVTNDEIKLSKQESMNNRLARYIDRVRHLEVENRTRCLKEAEDRLNEQHETHTNRIQELREKYENQMKLNREEIKAVYDTKIKAVRDGAQRDKNLLADALKELKSAQDRIDDSNAKIVILEQINLSLHDRFGGLQSALESERSRSAKCHTEINRLREEIALQLEEHQDLLVAKHSLAMEITLYDKLLSDAEKPSKGSTIDLMSSSRKRKSSDALKS